MKKPKEHWKISFENFIEKMGQKLQKKLDKLSNVDEEQLRRACKLAGVQYIGEDDAVQELRNYTYKRLDKLRDQLETEREELSQQLKELTERVSAIGTSLALIERAEEAKLKADIQKLKDSGVELKELEEELGE